MSNDKYLSASKELITDESEIVERLKKAMNDNGISISQKIKAHEVRLSSRWNTEDDKLVMAIMRFEEILEQFDRDIELYDSIGISIDFSDRKEYQQLVDWLKELRDRRKEEWL